MLFKNSDYILIQTSSSEKNPTNLDEVIDLDNFKVKLAAGIGSGPQRVFDTEFSLADLEGFPAVDLADYVGEWTAVAERLSENGKEILIFSDTFGYSPVFYSITDDGMVVISDSFYGARAGLTALGQDITLNLANYITTLSSVNSNFLNPGVKETMANEISILPLDVALLVRETGVFRIPRAKLGRSAAVKSFDEAVEKGVLFASESLKTLFDVPGVDKTLFLSGGVDSRLLLALCLNAGLSNRLTVRAADPLNFPKGRSRDTVTKDIRISNTIREDFDLSWWEQSPSIYYGIDFRESRASFQTYRSNFSYGYSSLNRFSVSMDPVIALRGGGGEMLRSTSESINIENAIRSLVSSNKLEDGKTAEKLASWFMHSSKFDTSFNSVVEDFMKKIFEGFTSNSVAETMNLHYLHTRNRTHFGHTKYSHINNEVAFHFLSNSFFKRAREFSSFDELLQGELVKEIFLRTEPKLLDYPFENDDWTVKLSSAPLTRISDDDTSWRRELDSLADRVSNLDKMHGWGRNDRGVKATNTSIEEKIDFIRRSFDFITSEFEADMKKQVGNFHRDILSVISTQPGLIDSTVAKVNSAVDVFFPIIRKGQGVLLQCINSPGRRPSPLRSSKPDLLAVPQDGWNNVPTVRFAPEIFLIEDGLAVTAGMEEGATPGTEFAFYLYRNEEHVYTKWYQSKMHHTFTVPRVTGTYYAKVFVKTSSVDAYPRIEATNRISIECVK